MIDYFMSNDAIIRYVGEQVKQMRLNARLSQRELAEQAGIARSTIVAMETGHGIALDSLISILRVMRKLSVLDAFATEALVSPLQIARNAGKTPERIYKKRVKKND